MGADGLAKIAAGAFIVVVATGDVFLTVFNYDGFTFAAGRFQNWCWRLTLAATALAPRRVRQATRSLGSAALLPATVALWLAAEITGFALIYWAGLGDHGLTLSKGVSTGFGSAYYLSAGAQTSLTFGDIVPHGGLYQALVDLQTFIGLTTITLALGYVVTTFGILGNLSALHNTVRRHARYPGRPTSILARHYRGGEASELPDLLHDLSERLESYDEGLRRYPVVYYFHTRRAERSIPEVFVNLGGLLAAIRWGLPPGDAMSADPWLAALLEQYSTTIGRLQRSFVGPEHFRPIRPVTVEGFQVEYFGTNGNNPGVLQFLDLQRKTRQATGLVPPPDEDLEVTYQSYCEWLIFDRRTRTVLERVAQNLGYGSLPPPAPGPADDGGADANGRSTLDPRTGIDRPPYPTRPGRLDAKFQPPS